MPLFYFRIRNGPFSGAADRGCADLVAGIARHVQQNTEWQMELLDESKRPVFRIRLLAETMETLQPAKAP
jgi:hypothetical protein